MKQRNSEEWIVDLEKVGVPCGPINNLKQVFEHPQVKARDMKMELSHPLAGSVPQVANPIRFVGKNLDVIIIRWLIFKTDTKGVQGTISFINQF